MVDTIVITARRD